MKTLNFVSTRPYKKLYYFLKAENFSESLISSLRKRDGAMLVNGKNANMRTIVHEGDRVSVNFVDLVSTEVELCDEQLQMLYEDEDILVVDKPSGLATIPTRSHYSHNLAGAVAKYMLKRNEPFVFRAIGRLDKDTSGIIIIALNQWAAEKVRAQKSYIALCHGHFEKEEFDIDEPILTQKEGSINIRKRQISDSGKPAQTHVKVIKNEGYCSLVELKLSHGRTHQIRLHLSSIGHPICGDTLYGTPDDFPRLMLDCHRASITLPSGKVIEVISGGLKSKMKNMALKQSHITSQKPPLAKSSAK